MNSESACQGLTERMFHWPRLGWETASGPMFHSDLWQEMLFIMRMHERTFRFLWVPSHVGVAGNEGADNRAGKGRAQHPHNEVPHVKWAPPDREEAPRGQVERASAPLQADDWWAMSHL